MSHPSVHPAAAAAHGNLRSYVIGLALSALLTLGSFGVVMGGLVPRAVALAVIVALCVAQLIVQLVYFLHLGTRKDSQENSAIFVCTALLVVIIVAGSLWVMHNADVNMMPTSMSPDRAMSKD